MMKIIKTSIYPDTADNIFKKLKKLKTLQYVAFPYASFKSCNGNDKIVWEKEMVYDFSLNLFCVIPLGIHKIKVMDFSQNSIYTNEGNKFVPVWNHRIYLKELNNGFTEYTDEVEINAGWKTIFVYLWANLFYAHRQRKWKRLILRSKM